MTSLVLVSAVAEVRVGSSDNVVRVVPDPASSLGCRKDGLGGLAGSEASRFESLTGMLIGPLEILPTSMSTGSLNTVSGISEVLRSMRPLPNQTSPAFSKTSPDPRSGGFHGFRHAQNGPCPRV